MNDTSAASSILIIHNKDHSLHKQTDYHPERPERLDSIIERLSKTGVLKKCLLIDEYPTSSECITLAHESKYIELIQSFSAAYQLGDAYYTKDTHQVSVSAVSGACLAIDNVLTNQAEYAFCFIRPPGHHANISNDHLTGFCIYNNVAVAALYARQKYNTQKILIFDWDVHHGDSTQKIFNSDPNTLFCSIHKYQQGGFYPGHSGSYSNVGEGAGRGFNINCTWDVTEESGCCRTVGDNEYVYLLEAMLMPIIRSFKPELVLVSAGYDAGNGDPLGGISVSPFGFSYMLKRLLGLGTKVVLCLEGGYNLDVNAISAEYCVRTLLGESVPVNNGPEKWSMENMREKCFPNKVALDLVDKIVKVHSKYWSVLMNEEQTSFREKMKERVARAYGEDILLCSRPVLAARKNILLKEFKFEDQVLFRFCRDPSSGIGKSLESLEEYLPKFVKSKKMDGVKLSGLCFNAESYKDCSYFIMKLGCDDMGTERDVYQNKNSRLLKVVYRDSDNKIIEKWDECENYGVNYDMKVNDWDHDRFIYFLRFFLESHDKARPNYTAFRYFRDFATSLEKWMSRKTRIGFSSLTFGFFVNNIVNQYNVCLLDFGDVRISEEESQDHDPTIYSVVKEMKETLYNDEDFVLGE